VDRRVREAFVTIDAAALRALCDAAAKGPWVVWKGHADVYAGEPRVNTPGRLAGCTGQIASCDHQDFGDDDREADRQDRANAAFIAAAREALPALLDRVAAAEKRAEEAEDQVVRQDDLHRAYVRYRHRAEVAEAKLAVAVEALEAAQERLTDLGVDPSDGTPRMVREALAAVEGRGT
jgi:hypothetical protein